MCFEIDDGFRGASVPVLLFIHYFEHLKGVEDWRSNWLLGVMLGSMENEKLTNTVTYALPGDSWRALRTGSVVDVVSMRQERSVDGGGAS